MSDDLTVPKFLRRAKSDASERRRDPRADTWGDKVRRARRICQECNDILAECRLRERDEAE